MTSIPTTAATVTCIEEVETMKKFSVRAYDENGHIRHISGKWESSEFMRVELEADGFTIIEWWEE